MKVFPVLCTLIADRGVEIVTTRIKGEYLTQVNGGRLDGETFRCRNNPRGQHEWACELVRRDLDGRRIVPATGFSAGPEVRSPA
jgi:hypothetical protein